MTVTQARKTYSLWSSPVTAPTHLTRTLLITLFIAGLVVTAMVVLVVLPRSASTLDYGLQLGDLYDFIGNNLALGHGYRVDVNMGETMMREPGYPLLMAGVFKITGYGVVGPRIACIALAFAAALILRLLALEITGNGVVSVIAALMFLLYPANLVAEARAGVEMLCVSTVLLFMLALYRALQSGSIWQYGMGGLLLGVASLVRSEVILFPSLVLLYLLFTSSDWRERGKALLRMSVLGIAALTVMSPWIIRNYLLVHQFVPTTTLSGVAAQEGLYTCKHLPEDEEFFSSQRGAGHERSEIAKQLGFRFDGTYYYQFFYIPQDELAFNRVLLSSVSKEYRSSPALLADCAAKNLFFKFWFLGKTPRATYLNIFVQSPLLLLAFGGVIVLYKRKHLQKAAMVLLYIAYVPLVHAAIIAHARHSMFVVPFLAVLAAIFLVWAWDALRTQHGPRKVREVQGSWTT